MSVDVGEPEVSLDRAVFVDGLTLSTSIDVPGIQPVAEEPDWQIKRVSAPPGYLDAATRWLGSAGCFGEVRGRFGSARGAHRVQLLDVGELVAWPKEKRAIIHVSPQAADDRAALSQLLPYLAAIGGDFVLHGACVSFPTGGVLLCSPSDTGKSTLALALDAIGRPVVADDHVVLGADDKRFAAHPSFAFIDASRESSLLFRPDTFTTNVRHTVRLSTPPPTAPIPLTRIAFLLRGKELSVRRLSAGEAAAGLRECLVSLHSPGDEAAATKIRSRAQRLAKSVVALELTLPEGLDRLSAELGRLQELLIYS